MSRDTSFLTKALVAHRGYHNIEKGIPENTMSAFREAIINNLIIELDVHILKDGKIVVFHDDNLKRMTNIDKNIKDMSYDEIKDIKLLNTNETIPLFENVLKLIDGQVPLIIELKHDVKCGILEPALIKILKDYNGEYAVKSFNPLTVNYFRKYSPNTIRGQLSYDFSDKKINKLEKYVLKNMLFNIITKPDFISYGIHSLPNNKVKKIRKNKLILGWTVKSKEDLEHAKKYCDNFICENIDFNNL